MTWLRVPSGPSLNGRSRAVGARPRRGGPVSLSSGVVKIGKNAALLSDRLCRSQLELGRERQQAPA